MPANDWLVGGGTQPDVRGFITWVYALKVVKQPMTVERTKPFWLGHLHDMDLYQLFFLAIEGKMISADMFCFATKTSI